MTVKLEAKIRTALGKKNEALRRTGVIPAIVYGHGQDNQNLEINSMAFAKVFAEAGESTLVDLAVEGQEPVKVIVADVQHDPIKGDCTHVDFHQIRMDEKIHATVQLKFIGESKAVREEGGVLIHTISELHIHCLPIYLVHEIEVDITPLIDFNAVVAVKDIQLPTGVELDGQAADDVIAKVMPPRTEAELQALETPAAPEVAPAEGAVVPAAEAVGPVEEKK